MEDKKDKKKGSHIVNIRMNDSQYAEFIRKMCLWADDNDIKIRVTGGSNDGGNDGLDSERTRHSSRGLQTKFLSYLIGLYPDSHKKKGTDETTVSSDTTTESVKRLPNEDVLIRLIKEKELSKIGANLNQLTRAVNRLAKREEKGSVSQAQLEYIERGIDYIRQALGLPAPDSERRGI